MCSDCQERNKIAAERDVLRAENAELKATVEFRTKVMEDNVTYCNGLEKEKRNLQAERDRYREALERLSQSDEDIDITVHPDDFRAWVKAVCKAALGEKPE